MRYVGFLVAACGLLVVACELSVATCMRDLAPQPGIEPRPPALGAQSPTHWTTREVPEPMFLDVLFLPRMFWVKEDKLVNKIY